MGFLPDSQLSADKIRSCFIKAVKDSGVREAAEVLCYHDEIKSFFDKTC